jgi:hypothetical protein
MQAFYHAFARKSIKTFGIFAAKRVKIFDFISKKMYSYIIIVAK